MTVKAIKIRFSLYGSCSLLGYRYNTFSLFIVEHLVDELNQDFLKRYFFIHYLHTNTQMNITCTGMLFIAKWEKVYSFELFISFNWANNSKNSVTTYQNHFNTSFIYKKKQLYEKYQIVLPINSLFIWYNYLSLPSLYMDNHVYKISIKMLRLMVVAIFRLYLSPLGE